VTVRWVWVSVAALVVVFALGFLYIGTTHRDRCIKDGNAGCSILPWSGRSNDGWGNAVIP
jgi:hypothetical protein